MEWIVGILALTFFAFLCWDQYRIGKLKKELDDARAEVIFADAAAKDAKRELDYARIDLATAKLKKVATTKRAKIGTGKK